MLIGDLKLKNEGANVRATALVEWEDTGLEPREVFVETTANLSGQIEPNPNAFLAGCIIPAIARGEKRIKVEGQVSPVLLEGLSQVLGHLDSWYGPGHSDISIEAQPSRTERDASDGRRTGLFFSGGIDSLAALKLNCDRFAVGHPARVLDCYLVHGFDIGGVMERGSKYEVFDRATKRLELVCAEQGAELIKVYTNFRHLCDERELWLNKFFGAVLAGVGHVLSPRMGLAYLASSYDIPNLVPCGSHPLIDTNYSSHEMRIIHRDTELSRMEKLELLAQWPTGLDNMRVCLRNDLELYNCGTCEKCVRTMIGLEALGALSGCKAFPSDVVTPGHLAPFKITIRHREPFYEEMLAPLRAAGRDDLAEEIERKLAEGD